MLEDGQLKEKTHNDTQLFSEECCVCVCVRARARACECVFTSAYYLCMEWMSDGFYFIYLDIYSKSLNHAVCVLVCVQIAAYSH